LITFYHKIAKVNSAQIFPRPRKNRQGGARKRRGRADGDLPPHPRPPSALHDAPSGAKAQWDDPTQGSVAKRHLIVPDSRRKRFELCSGIGTFIANADRNHHKARSDPLPLPRRLWRAIAHTRMAAPLPSSSASWSRAPRASRSAMPVCARRGQKSVRRSGSRPLLDRARGRKRSGTHCAPLTHRCFEKMLLTNLTYILHSLIKWAQNENSLQIHRD
jgi:hypothetical protein